MSEAVNPVDQKGNLMNRQKSMHATVPNAAPKLISPQFTKSEQQEFVDLFSLLDRSKSGKVTRQEIFDLFSILQFQIGPEEEALLMSHFDEAKFEFNFDDFMTIILKKFKGTYPAQSIEDSFRALSIVGNQELPENHIEKKQLLRSLKIYNHHNLSPEELTRMVEAMPFNQQGICNFVDYAKVLSAPEKFENLWNPAEASSKKFHSWSRSSTKQ